MHNLTSVLQRLVSWIPDVFASVGIPGAAFGSEMSTHFCTSENTVLERQSGTAFPMSCLDVGVFFSVLPKQQAEIKSHLHSTAFCKLATLIFLGNSRDMGSYGSVYL